MNKKMGLIIVGAMLLSWASVFAVLAVIPKHVPPIVYILLVIFMTIDLFMIFIIMGKKTRLQEYPSSGTLQSDSTPYSDSLISIDDNGLTIRLYYFPFGAKRVNFSDIEKIEVYKGGNMRLWGSDNFRTWFGLDWKRINRTMTFIIKRKNKWSRIGFTCEDSEKVANILRSKTILEFKTG
jgi:hypothetical protein